MMSSNNAVNLSLAISAIDAYRRATDLGLQPNDRVTVLPVWAVNTNLRNPHLHPVRIQWADGRILRSVPDELSWYGTAGRNTSTDTCTLAEIARGAILEANLRWLDGPVRSTPARLKEQHDRAMYELFGVIEIVLKKWVRRLDAQRLGQLIDAEFIKNGRPMSDLDIEVAVSEWMLAKRPAASGGGLRWLGIVDRLVAMKFLPSIDSPYLWLSTELRRDAPRVLSSAFMEPPIAERIRRLWAAWSPDHADTGSSDELDARFLAVVRSAMPSENVGPGRLQRSLDPVATPQFVLFNEMDEGTFDESGERGAAVAITP